MKKFAFILSLLVGASTLLTGSIASAAQDFSCKQMQKDGSFTPTSFGLSLVSSQQLEVLNNGEVAGLYNRNSAKNLIWTTFVSVERINMTVKIAGKMYFGHSGYVKHIHHAIGASDVVTVYFCEPGQLAD
jgi:hypothetical protein